VAQGIFPSKFRGPIEVHAMSGSNMFAIQITLRPSLDDPSEYHIYEIWYKERLQKPIRELVRVLHLQWSESNLIDQPDEQTDVDSDDEFDEESDEEPIEQRCVFGTLFHEPFSRLTVVQDKQKKETKFCYLEKARPHPEVVAQLDGNCSMIDEYHECIALDNDIGTLLNTEAES
jgi:hypothetical protein